MLVWQKMNEESPASILQFTIQRQTATIRNPLLLRLNHHFTNGISLTYNLGLRTGRPPSPPLHVHALRLTRPETTPATATSPLVFFGTPILIPRHNMEISTLHLCTLFSQGRGPSTYTKHLHVGTETDEERRLDAGDQIRRIFHDSFMKSLVWHAVEFPKTFRFRRNS